MLTWVKQLTQLLVRCTCVIMWLNLSVTYDWLIAFSEYSGFLQQLPLYNKYCWKWFLIPIIQSKLIQIIIYLQVVYKFCLFVVYITFKRKLPQDVIRKEIGRWVHGDCICTKSTKCFCWYKYQVLNLKT